DAAEHEGAGFGADHPRQDRVGDADRGKGGELAAAVAVGPNLATLPPAPTLLLVAGLLAGIVGLNLATGAWVFRRAVRDLRPALAQGAD
ncbi:MAG: hypothetical protein ACKOTE_03540, partial [Opitutaceae bacterium]